MKYVQSSVYLSAETSPAHIDEQWPPGEALGGGANPELSPSTLAEID